MRYTSVRDGEPGEDTAAASGGQGPCVYGSMEVTTSGGDVQHGSGSRSSRRALALFVLGTATFLLVGTLAAVAVFRSSGGASTTMTTRGGGGGKGVVVMEGQGGEQYWGSSSLLRGPEDEEMDLKSKKEKKKEKKEKKEKKKEKAEKKAKKAAEKKAEKAAKKEKKKEAEAPAPAVGKGGSSGGGKGKKGGAEKEPVAKDTTTKTTTAEKKKGSSSSSSSDDSTSNASSHSSSSGGGGSSRGPVSKSPSSSSSSSEDSSTSSSSSSEDDSSSSEDEDSSDDDTPPPPRKCRDCTASECKTLQCNAEASPYACVKGKAAGGCTKTESDFLNPACTDCCSLKSCATLWPGCGQCSPAECTQYKVPCGATRPYACLSGDAKGGCSNATSDWGPDNFFNGVCTKCCDLTTCGSAPGCGNCTLAECRTYRIGCNVQRPYACTAGAAHGGCAPTQAYWQHAEDVGICTRCCNTLTCSSVTHLRI